MEYKELIRDFAIRTRKNLSIIEKLKDDPEFEAFEVTQLVNSTLGLLVFPHEKYMGKIPDIPLTELENQGWPTIKITKSGKPCKTLDQLVKNLRNSIAHCNVEFTDRGGQINGLKIWNESRGRRVWEAELYIEDLRRITECFINLILENEEFKF